MIWFKVTVEDERGFRAIYSVEAISPTAAREKTASNERLTVVSVETWGANTRWPGLPNYAKAALLLALTVCSCAQADLLAEFSWRSPQPTANPIGYSLYSQPIFHPAEGSPMLPDYVPMWTEFGGSWTTTGDATLYDVAKFDEWWTELGRYAIYFGANDAALGWQSPPGSRYGVSLDWVLDGGGTDVGWSATRYVPTLLGAELTHLVRLTTPTSHRIEIHGNAATAVPEPEAYWMMAVAGLLFMVFLWSKRKR